MKPWSKLPVLESSVERQFCNQVKKLHCKAKKLNGLGDRDWPDRLIIGPYGFSCLIEFKRPNESLSDKQEKLHNELKELGHNPQTFDNWKDAIEYVKDGILRAKFNNVASVRIRTVSLSKVKRG